MMQECGQEPVKVCVLGAGVIGLATAVRIAEDSQAWRKELGKDIKVTLMADRFSPNTTSDGSGGLWEPYNLGRTQISLIKKWSSDTWDHMQHLASTPALAQAVGAQFVSGYTIKDEKDAEDPFFKDILLGFRRLTPREMHMFPFAGSGYFSTTLQLNTKLYLPWLTHRFLKAGGSMEQQSVENIQQVADRFEVIVNCCGPRAGTLVADSKTVPIRGQVRRIRAPWVKHFYLYDASDGGCSYVLPIGDEVVIGGVAQRGRFSEEVDQADSEDIWRRAVSCFPIIEKGLTLSEWAGVRPGRETVRVDGDQCSDSSGRPVTVIHNYGHGGAGVTLHWGCAGDATELVHKAVLTKLKKSLL